jgi:hypothetical protein
MRITTAKGKFSLGSIVVTAGVADKSRQDEAFNLFVLKSVGRHASGDWGEMTGEDMETNNIALMRRERIFSSYETPGYPKIWIITEADRSSTCVLFPEEY